MPDLQPDTSLYATIAKNANSGPLASSSLGDLLGMASKARDLQTQSAISDAVKGNTDPSTGITDWKGVMSDASQSGAYLDPQTMSHMSGAAITQLAQKQQQLDAVGKIMGPILDLGNKAGPQDVQRVAPMLAGLGVDPALIRATITSTDPVEFRRNLQLLQNATTGPEPLTTVPSQQGPVSIPAGAAAGAARGIPAVGETPAPGQTGPVATSGYSPGLPAPGGEERPFQVALARADTYTQDVLPLVQAIPAMTASGPKGMGPASDEFNTLKSFMSNIGLGDAIGIDVNKIKNYTEAKKYLVQWSDKVSGGGTNDRLAAAFSGNPNMTMMQAPALTVAKTMLSVRAMEQAQTREFQQTGLAPAQYQAWASNWNQRQDPRAFGFAMMDPASAAKMLKGMSPNERQRFEASLDVARKYPVTAPSGGWNVPAGNE